MPKSKMKGQEYNGNNINSYKNERMKRDSVGNSTEI